VYNDTMITKHYNRYVNCILTQRQNLQLLLLLLLLDNERSLIQCRSRPNHLSLFYLSYFLLMSNFRAVMAAFTPSFASFWITSKRTSKYCPGKTLRIEPILNMEIICIAVKPTYLVMLDIVEERTIICSVTINFSKEK